MDANTPKISTVMETFGYQAGYAIDQRLKSMDQALKTKIDQEVAVLTGKDENFNTLINNLLRISDAEPGTPDWDEGQNLYTLMTNNYIALGDRITANEDAVAAINTWKTTFVSQYNTAIANINTRIDDEIAARQAEITRIEAKVGQNALKGNANEVEITAAKQRLDAAEVAISQLQTTQTQYGEDIAFIKSRFADLGTSDAMPHFMEGLNGADSSAGYSPYAPA